MSSSKQMTHDKFFKKWHNLTDSVVKHLQLSSLFPDSLGDIENPIGNTILKLECHLRYDDRFALIRESVESSPIHDRSVDDVAKSLFYKLDQALARHIEQLKQLNHRPKQTKPIAVVVVGAGFSAGFGLPTTDGLKKYVGKLSENPSLGSFNDTPGLFDAARNCFPLNEYLKENGDIRDFEHLLTLWEGYRNQLEAYGDGVEDEDTTEKHDHKLYYRGVIENVCCHLYSLSREILQSPGPNRDLFNAFVAWLKKLSEKILKSPGSKRDRFNAFVEWLKKAKQDFDVRFVTFNYDVVLELAIQAADLDFEYLSRSKADNELVVPLRKLHGSVNWLERHVDSGNANQQITLLYKNNKRAIYAFPKVSECPIGLSGEMPVIIAPSANKTYGHLFEEVWLFAANDIELAERILIVGYSFPTVDIFARLHLQDLLKEKKNGLQYICKDADKDRIKEILGLTDEAIIDSPWEIDHFTNWLA